MTNAAGPIAVYVDADACPVKDEVYRVAGRHRLHVFVVANSFLNVPREPWIERVTVPGNFDAADDWIAERVSRGAIVITADIPLADRCIKAGADVIGPTGKPFTEASIGIAEGPLGLPAGARPGDPAPEAGRFRSLSQPAMERLV